jgi:membrane-associated phospholipid phosphatase
MHRRSGLPLRWLLVAGLLVLPRVALAGSDGDGPNEVDPAAPAVSETQPTAAPLNLAHPYGFHQIGLDARYLVTRPAHLDRTGVIKIALTAATTGVLYLYRKDIRDWVLEHNDPGRTQFVNQARLMGKGAFAPSLALIAYGASFATKNPREKETSVLLLESMGFTGIATGIGQAILATQRPDEGDAINYFARRGHGVSGDAALAASVVPILSRQYLTVWESDGWGPRTMKVAGASMLYAGAFLTGYQRLDADKHWAPDVFLGLVTGFSIGQMLCDSHRNSARQSPVSVDFSAGGGALQARITF